VLMSDWWVLAHWGRTFEIVDVARQIQNFTWVLLRKRDVELTTGDLERAEDDPREYAALRHSLHQVQREVDTSRGELKASLDRQRREYEASLSRRLTRPLRAGARLARSLRSYRSR
jgi:hypothetical protein